MYGPLITEGDLALMLLIVLMVGGALGVGCYEGCGYARRHIDVEWVD
jgi:hypothetical protein